MRRAALLLAALGAVLALPPRARKLNAPLPRASLGDVRDFRLVPGQERVVYLADGDVDELFELYSFTPGGGDLARLDPPRDFIDVQLGAEVDPSGRRVVYRNTSFGNLSVPVDGSAPPVRLGGLERFSSDGEYVLFRDRQVNVFHRQLFAQRVEGGPEIELSGDFTFGHDIPAYAVTADSRRVVFLANLRDFGRYEVFGVPIDGSRPFRPLNGRLEPGRNVTDFELAAEAQLVVYRADQQADEGYQLFLVPADGGAPPVSLTPLLPAGRVLEREFRVNAAGTSVAFMADLDEPGVRRLYGLAPASGALVDLSPPLAPGGSVLGALQLSSDGRWIVFRADPLGTGAVELWTAPLDGGAPARRLHDALAPGATLGRSEISADSTRAVFLRRGASVELWSAPLDGSAPAVALHPPLVPGGDVVRFELAGARAVYRADQDVDEVLELFSAPLDASAPPLRLHPPLPAGRTILPDFRVSADGRTVGFLADLLERERFELFTGPVDGSAPPRRASAPGTTARIPVGEVRAFAPAGDFAVYTADQEEVEAVGLYSVPRDGRRGPLRLHAPATEGGDVSAFAVTQDERRVVFAGDLELDGAQELWSAPADASAPAVKLNGPLAAGGSVAAWRLAPDGARVAFAAGTSPGRIELYAVATDGSTPPRPLDPPPHRTFGSVGALELTPDGRSVVYTSDNARRGRFELYSVPLDGGAPSVRLSALTALGGDVLDFRLAPDSTWAVYRADQDTDDLPELYGVPLDGRTPPVKLSPPIGGNQRVWDYAIGAGNRVVLTAGLAYLRELYGVPIDASVPPRRFLAGLEQTHDFWLTPAGTRVLFRSGFLLELFCAPIDAAAPPVHLDGPLPRSSFFEPLFPDEDTAIYFAGTTGRPPGTYRTRLDGSRPPEHLDQGVPHGLSPERLSALVHGGLRSDGVYVLPLDGSGPARRVSQRLAPEGRVVSAVFANGGDVLYLATQDRFGVRELYASSDGPSSTRSGGTDGQTTTTR